MEIELNAGRANRVRLNRTPLTRPRDVLGVLRTVLFAPEDLALVKGDPGERRRFLDDLLVAMAPRYAAVRADYERVLKQRTALLKSAGPEGRAQGQPAVQGGGDRHPRRLGRAPGPDRRRAAGRPRAPRPGAPPARRARLPGGGGRRPRPGRDRLPALVRGAGRDNGGWTRGRDHGRGSGRSAGRQPRELRERHGRRPDRPAGLYPQGTREREPRGARPRGREIAPGGPARGQVVGARPGRLPGRPAPRRARAEHPGRCPPAATPATASPGRSRWRSGWPASTCSGPAARTRC